MAGQWSTEGKSVLVTGGASGIGALYAEAFLKEGAKKVAIADISEELGKTTAAKLNAKYPGKVIFVKCDVGTESEVASTFDKVVKEFGHLDVVINNAGIMSDNPAVVWKACVVNWPGLVSFTMRAQKHMRKDEGGAGGTIINISSTAGLQTVAELPAYAGSKAAVLHFSKGLATPPFFEETGVRILTLCPGPTDTPLLQGIKERCYNEKMGEQCDKNFAEMCKTMPSQKPEAAAVALIKMYREGENGSVWLTAFEKPGKDITYITENGAQEEIQKMAMK